MIYLLANIGGESAQSLLPHFINHYKKLGIEKFLIVVHGGIKPPGTVPQIKKMLSRFNIDVCKTWYGEYSDGVKDTELKNKVLRENCNQKDWIINADLDEFQVYPKYLPDLLKECDKNGYDHLIGRLIDRITANGSFPPISKSIPIWQQFPIACHLTEEVIGGYTRKVIAMRGYMTMKTGHHKAKHGFRPYPKIFEVHHFKWDNTIITRTRERLKTFEKTEQKEFIDNCERFLRCLKNERIDLTKLSNYGFTNKTKAFFRKHWFRMQARYRYVAHKFGIKKYY